MEERYDLLRAALETERKEEEEYFRQLSASKTIKERIDTGVLWYPVSIDKMHYSIAEKVELELTPALPSSAARHNLFRVGASASFFINDEEKIVISGVISFASRGKVRVILNQDVIVKDYILKKGNCGIELIYDDRPYRVMMTTLDKLKKSKFPEIVALREGITHRSIKQKKIDLSLDGLQSLDHLNTSQKQAVLGCMSTEELAIIHGPPGTGKTTTLVAVIRNLAQTESKILVTAPSNNAVDLLTKRLHEEGVNVLRVGNVTRIGDNIAHLCLDEKVRRHKDWQHIKRVKIEAEAAKKEADKYKRKYGPQQRRMRQMFVKEGRELAKWARQLEHRLVDHVLDNCKVVCTTLIGSAHKTLEGWVFDTVIIDEGSQALEPESWTAMIRGKRTIIAGDHFQLPPTVKSQKAVAQGLTETILDRMTDQIEHSYLLDTQYRMNSKILQFSNEQFYGGKLKSADFVKDRSLRHDDEIVTMIDTSGCGFDETTGKNGRSRANLDEYHIIREHILSIPHLLTPAVAIGIISPYALQVTTIRQEISEDEILKNLDIQVNSIDGFQGQEKDVIYLSLVRSNDRNEIGFLKDYRRLNVALTRAKYKLIVVGDMATLATDKLYMSLSTFIENNGTYKSAWEYMYSGK